jgi:hypothetical protein
VLYDDIAGISTPWTEFPTCTSNLSAPTVALYQTEVDAGSSITWALAGTTTANAPAEAYGFIAAWHSSDLDKFTPTSAPILNVATFAQSEVTSTSIRKFECTGDNTGALVCLTGGSAHSIPNPFTGSFATLASVPTAGSVGPYVASATGTAEAGKDATRKGLSSSELIGVEVGAVVGFVALLAGFGYLLFRKKMRKQS